MPPLIVHFVDHGFELCDGNHRFEALTQLGVKEYPFIVWITEKDEYEEFVEKWKEEYPDEEKWYHFFGVEIDNEYQSISINNCHVIQVSPQGGNSSFPYDISEFISFLKEKVEFCLYQIREGMYMDFVRPRIPDTYKTGTILQGDLWELDPEEKEAYFEGLSESDIAEFLDSRNRAVWKQDLWCNGH